MVGSVLDSLLEGFDPGEARGFHGRWVRGHGGKPGRIEGTYHGVKLERGVAYQGRLATGKIHTGVWNGKVTGRGVDDPNAHPEFRHVDTGEVRTFQGGEFFGKLKDMKPGRGQ